MPDALRILLVSGEYPPMEGGVADFTHLLSQAMAGAGHDIHVLTAREAAGAADEGITVHPLMRSWGFGGLYATLRRLCARLRPDVVNVQYQTAAYGMHPAVNLLPRAMRRLPVVTTFHDLLVPYLFPKAGRVRDWVNLELARSSRAAIVTNAEDERRLAGAGLAYVTRIPIGSNIDCALPPDYQRDARRARWGVAQSTLLLSYFGFLNASKGGEELVAAVDLLVRAGRDVRLLMIGGAVGASDATNRAYLARVEESIHERGLDQRVIWTGYLAPDEVSAALTSSDLCVLPYRDGVSFRRGSFMAALAHGVPVVTTQPALALPELHHGVNVWLVPPSDPAALAAGVAHLADHRAIAGRLGVQAARLSQEFGWPHIAERTVQVYHAAIQR
ncbi:MAG: glycosyltransferase family 4 protein [Anaerolineae bacterium]